jgi:nucleoid DNA-binding protein
MTKEKVSLNKNRMVREIGRRTRLKNRDVQLMLETLIDVWTEELVIGGRIELENFLVLETQTIDRGEQPGILTSGKAPRVIKRVVVRASKKLKQQVNPGSSGSEFSE